MPSPLPTSAPRPTRAWMRAFRASVVVFALLAVGFGVSAANGAGSGAWAAAGGFAVAAVGQAAGLVSVRRKADSAAADAS